MRKIGLMTLMLLVSTMAFAQPGPPTEGQKKERMEKIKAAKVAFITQQLELTPEEAEKFWPVYNQWDADKKSLREKNKLEKKPNMLTDKEAEQLILNQLAMEEDLVKLNKDYYFKLKEIISPNRILKLHRAEKQFRKRLLKRLNAQKKRRSGGKFKKGNGAGQPMHPPGERGQGF